jgi:hypothetical protein
VQPIRLKTQLATDVEGIRRLLLAWAPRLEARQPGLTAQLAAANLKVPLLIAGRKGDSVKVSFTPQGLTTLVFVEAIPPLKPMGPLRGRFWRWRTRALMRWALKQAKRGVEKQVKTESTIAKM